MNKCVLTIVLSVILFSSCEQIEKAISDAENSKKNETKQSKVRDGVIKKYFKNGSLKTAITYHEGVKHGIAKSYYKDGKLRQEINYAENKKQGKATTYYENGKVFQITQYENDTIQGIREKYRQNGDLMAEIPYHGGRACQGLKEYLLNGDLKKKYPKIIINEADNLLRSNKFTLIVKLSDGSKRVKYSIGKLTKGGCPDEDVFKMNTTKPGILEITYNLKPGMFMMEELNFIAEVKTKLGNPYITQKKYNLAVENKGY